jgi:hypothetical protein
VSPNTTSSGEGIFFIPFKDGKQLSPKSFPVIQSYDPHDLNSIEQAYKKGYYPGQMMGQENRVVIGGDGRIDSIFIVVRAKSELVSQQKLFINVHPLFQLSSPIPGVKTTVTALMNTGGAPGPTPPSPTDPTVTTATPATFPELVPTNISVYGSNFQDGATVQVIGPTAAVAGAVTFVSDTQLRCDVTITQDPLVPAPNNYDVLVVNPDGGNGIGVGVISST